MMDTKEPEIEVLAMDVGVWLAAVEVRPFPGAEPQTSEGAMTCRMCGPWLVTDFKNESSGFEGHGIYGWDPAKKTYVGTWVDSMRRSLVLMTGAWDSKARAMTFAGEMNKPDGTPMKWREITEKPDDTSRVFRTLVRLPDGSEHTMMTARYRRRT